jgi:hypothetical protein
MPEIAGTDEQGNGLHIQLVDGASFSVAIQERFPAHSNRILKAAAPQEDGKIVNPVAISSAVEVKEGHLLF